MMSAFCKGNRKPGTWPGKFLLLVPSNSHDGCISKLQFQTESKNAVAAQHVSNESSTLKPSFSWSNKMSHMPIKLDAVFFSWRHKLEDGLVYTVVSRYATTPTPVFPIKHVVNKQNSANLIDENQPNCNCRWKPDNDLFLISSVQKSSQNCPSPCPF